MEFNLDKQDQEKIKSVVVSIVQDAINQVNTDSCPYLNRKEIAKYFGVADSTISYWASLGMPVAIIDGRKLYGKQSITQWLKDHEINENEPKEQRKKPVTIGVVTGKK